MPKHKKETGGSVALFDEAPIKTKPDNRPVKKKTEKSSKSTKGELRENIILNVKSSSKTAKTSKKQATRKSDDIHKSKSRSTAIVKHSKSDTNDQPTKQSRKTEKREHIGTSQVISKSKVNKRAISKSDDSTVKGRSKVVGNRKSNKDSADISKKRKSVVKSKSVTDSRKTARVAKGSKPVKDTEPRIDTRIDADIKEAKKYWRKHRYDRTESISQPRAITGKPKQIDDDFSLVSIMVDGKYLEVSPWSIINGVYHPGLDSNFIVNRLNAGTSSPNLLPKLLANPRKKKEKK